LFQPFVIFVTFCKNIFCTEGNEGASRLNFILASDEEFGVIDEIHKHPEADFANHKL
jgi:hypothetical protein